MAEPLHSPHWYRIAALRPALRPHLRLVRHEYRGEPWQVIHDPASGRQWRFSAGAERVIALMDGRRTVDQIWALAGEGVRDMPTQDEMLRLLAQLHAADALAVDVAPDLDELLRRHGARRARDLLGRFGNPLALRTRLLDPDAYLARLVPWIRPLLGRGGTLAWWGVLLAGITVAALHREELGRSLSDLLLAPGSLALALLVYPVIKLVHELAHGCAVKLRGGEVHEIGLMWLLFVPVPYVDASAASAFPDKRARMAVSAAGVRAEAFVAALAMLVWAAVEPGLVRALAYDVTLIAGVSTLLVNGNPLLRYDGYYWLADLLEMPNLAGRASQQLGSMLRRRVLGLEEARRSGDSRAERRWLVAYGLGALVYRGVVLLAIVAVVAAWSKLLALVVAVVLLALQAGVPALRALRGLAADPALQARPARPLLRGAAALATVASIALLPLPLVTFTQGVVWLPEQGEVRAGTDGELREWLAAPGSMVEAGAPLALLDDPLVDVRLAAAQAELDAAESRYLAARATDAVEAGTMLAQLERARRVARGERARRCAHRDRAGRRPLLRGATRRRAGTLLSPRRRRRLRRRAR